MLKNGLENDRERNFSSAKEDGDTSMFKSVARISRRDILDKKGYVGINYSFILQYRSLI
jgi:hypothetical protein